jgi:hypothetical protein
MIGFLFLLFNFSQAAPHPLTGSSIINSAQSNLIYSQMGFKVSGVPSNWIYKPGADDTTVSIDLGPADTQAKTTLSFHMETVAKKMTLEQYVRQYLRDYNQYGFEVTSLQSNKKNIVPSVIVDLTQKNKQTRSRQVFFLQNEKIIIASCLDDFDKFDKTAATCNSILGSFQWNKPNL